MEHEVDGVANCNWCDRNDLQRLVTGAERVGNRRTSGDHPNYSIVEICLNTEKSPGDLRRLSILKTPVKDHHLTLVRKTCKE